MSTIDLPPETPLGGPDFSAFIAQFPRSTQLLSPYGRTLAVNPAWEHLWGVSLAQLEAYNIREDPQLQENGVADLLERAFAGEAVELPAVSYVPPFGRFAGQARLVQATASPIFDAEGSVEMVVLVHEDVTELVEANIALQKAQELLEESQRSAHVGAWAWDLESGSLLWTEELYRIYGLEPGERLDFPRYQSLVHPDDRSVLDEVVQRSLRDDVPFAFDHRIIRPDGQERTLHGRGRVIRDSAGTPIRMVGSGQDITDRLQAEEIERTFAGVWEQAPIGIAVYDASDEFVCARHNRRFLDLVGKTFRRSGTVVGLSMRDLLNDESYARVSAIFQRVRATGEPFAIDEFPVVLLPDLEPRWYQWSLTPVQRGNEVVWLLVTAVEVTELVQARQERQALLDAVVEGIFGLDAAGRCSFINPAACRLLGYTAEECLGQDMHELVHYKHPDGTPYATEECAIQRAFTDGHRVNLAEETLWRKDGSPLHTLISIAPLVNSGGVVTGAVVSVHDIEDRLRAEEALKTSEARFRTLADSMVAGAVLGDATGHISYANDAFLRMVGYDRTDLEAGRVNWADLTPPEWLEVAPQAIAEARALGVSAPYEKEYVAKDGKRVPILVSLARTEVDGEEQFIGTVLDLRERKELERLQGDFLAMVTHDLRSPLTVVRTGAQLLQRSKDYRASTVDAMLASADKMARLIDDLADVVRLETGRFELQPDRCDLVALAHAEVAAASQRSEQRIRLEAPDEPLLGNWDGDRLAQVFQNLIGNALEHAPGSDVQVCVNACDGEIRITVSDQGPGIQNDHLPRLFERFYRADTTTGGHGLGLYISRMLVETHGGSIWAESKPGHGSTFTVSLPWSPSEASAS